MAKKEQSRPSLKKIRGLQLSMIIGYAVIIIAVICVVTNLAVKKTDAVLKNKVISMTSSLNVQILHSALTVLITLFTALSAPYNGALICIFALGCAYGFVFYKAACSVIDYESREL